MKITKILMEHSKNMNENQIKDFLLKNMPRDVLQGLEYDDPKTIERVLKLLKIKISDKDKQHIQDDQYLLAN